MVDWMIQVLRVLKDPNAFTFFRAVAIMDNYFLAKQKQGKVVKKGQLHIIGLVSMFMSSKFEEIDPIKMK
jgi:Cyclin, N-terminal domain